MRGLGVFLLGTAAAGPALAQSTPDVVRAADDAFGTRIGVEQVGLYSETNVRGLNLQDAGNYRVDGNYFIRSAAPANPVVAATTTRVGVNALRYDFPAPSGVVDFSLRRAEPGFQASVEAGVRANSGPFTEVMMGAARKDGRFGFAAGIHLYPWQTYADGAQGDFFAVGVTPRWSPSSDLTLTGLATQTWWQYDADVGYAVTGDFLPPRVRRRDYRGQTWTQARSNTSVVGFMVEGALPGDWRGHGSVFLSRAVDARSDFNLHKVRDPAGDADVTAFVVPRQTSQSWSGEAVASRTWKTGETTHRVVLMARGRDTGAHTNSGVAINLGGASLLAPRPELAEPELTFRDESTRDTVGQWTAGAGYRISFGDDVELRGDIQRTRYEKQVTSPGEAATSEVSSPWLFSASGLVSVSPKLTAFASYARGLEESGVAPANAVNRNEVLPAVIATQTELGLKYAVSPRLSLITGLFDISKPSPGLRADGSFDFIGTVRHRGAEFSLAGELTDHLSIVAGMSYLDATLAGELVKEGGIGLRPVGRPELSALANLTWRVGGNDGLALDAGVTYTGEKQANLANTFKAPGYATANAGLRYRFVAGDTSLTLRVRVTNLFDRFAWNATSSQLLFYIPPRSFALSINADL